MSDDVLIAPSLLSADFLRLDDELASIRSADLLHYDVMDGHFVPNLTFGPAVLGAVRSATDLVIDVHLMVDNPEEVVGAYLDAGAGIVSFHIEAQRHASRIVSAIHDAGAKAGVAVNPGTSVMLLDAIIAEVDLVLIMSVNPGFGGQPFMTSTYSKLHDLRKLCANRGVSPLVEVDGGVSLENVAKLHAAGADVLVAGTAIFGSNRRDSAIERLRIAARQGRVRHG